MTRSAGNAARVSVLAAFAVGASLLPMAATVPVSAQDAQPEKSPSPPTRIATAEGMCLLIESAATASGLPTEFLARVIWQESRWRADAVGPVTRFGTRAEGIAQFMPGTAAERELLDPFNPVQALPKAAEFLKELRESFGNLGLAAAAYNAGPQRVRDWMAGDRTLPPETRHYVLAITGTDVDTWADPHRPTPKRDKNEAAKNENGNNENNNSQTSGETKSPQGCGEIVALMKSTPNRFIDELEQRVARTESSPWGVQLAASFSRAQAIRSYARVMKKIGSAIEDRDPIVLAGVFRSRGSRPFYQVRYGADTRSAADGICSRVRKNGGACMVLRTRHSPIKRVSQKSGT